MQKDREGKRRDVKAKRKNRLQAKKEEQRLAKAARRPKREPFLAQDLLKYTSEEKMEAVVQIAATILESPETKYQMLQELLILLEDDDVRVLMTTLKKLCEVFVDIMPSYQIRPGKAEEQDKLSKEVRELQTYESSLLYNYSKYIKILQMFLHLKSKGRQGSKEGKSEEDQQMTELKECAFDCTCRLLEDLSHMNYAKTLANMVTQKLGSLNLKMRARSMAAVKDILGSLEDDRRKLDLKLQLTKGIEKLVKTKAHRQLDRRLLEVFREHKILVHRAEAEAKANPKVEQLKAALKQSKKQKKRQADIRELERELLREMRETSAVAGDAADFKKYNTEILREILAIYFYVLKDHSESPLLASVFEGLSHFAQHIDVEIVTDTLSVIKTYIKGGLSHDRPDLLNLVSALKCALEINSSLGRSFDVDERSFLNYGYKLLDFLLTQPSLAWQENCFKTLLASLELMFVTHKQLSLDVVAVYCKKLALIALHLSVEQCITLLTLLSTIFERYPRLKSLLDPEDPDCPSGGSIFFKAAEDPQFAVSASTLTIASEIQAIKQLHGPQSPAVVELITGISKHTRVLHWA